MNPIALWNADDQILLLAANMLIQVTVVTGVALALAAVARRNPAVRYGVLWTALLLVLLSPVLAIVIQTSGHGLLSVSLTETTRPLNSSAPVETPNSGEPPAGTEIPIVAFEPMNAFAEPGVAVDSVSPTPPAETAPAAQGVTATDSGSSPAATPSGDLLRAVMPPLLSIWIVGALVLLVRMSIAWRRLVALVRSARPVRNPARLAILEQVCRDLRLTRTAGLVVSPQVSGPISTGLLRPHVVLPEWMAERVTDEQLRAILVHEAAHILRRDQLAVLLQNMSAAVFWLHPLVRVLNRRLARAREEICDNYVLAANDAPSYSRTLLELARLIQTPGALPGTVGLLTSRWKLDRRVAGLLDENRSRMTALTIQGRALIAALAAVLLTVAACGTVTTEVAHADSSMQRLGLDGTESGLISENASRGDLRQPHEEATATAIVTQPFDQNSDADHRIVEGRVIDETRTAIEGALVVLPTFGAGDRQRDVAQGISDADGAFRLEVPVDRLEHPLWRNLTTLWVYKPGFALGSANVRPQLEPDGPRDAVEIPLATESKAVFTILDEAGDPASNVLVEPQHYREPRGYGIVPQEFLQHLAAETDNEGRVTIRGIEQGKLYKLLVRSVRHGTQEFRVDTLPDGEPLQLREAVSLTGRVIRGDPAWRRNIRLYFTTERRRRITADTPPQFGFTDAVGTAAVTTDAEGRFEIPQIATGDLRIEEALDSQLPVRLLLPERAVVPLEGDLILPLVIATNVRGRVVRTDGRTPVAGVNVSVRYGQYRQGDRGVTDENGEFEARVLPGRVYQQVMAIPDPDLTSVGSPWSEPFDVPITDEVFDLPVIELVGTHSQTGRLLDADGNPLANYRVWGVAGNRRYGFAGTNDLGEFEMKLPNGIEMETYGYSTPDDVLGRAMVLETEPLRLRAE